MLKLKYTHVSKGAEDQPYFHDELNDRRYETLLGGMSWPITDKGAAVVVARDFDSDHLWLVADHSGIPHDLFTFMSQAAKRWFCSKWYGNGFDEASIQFMHTWNRAQPKRTKVSLIDAPFVEEINAVPVYFQLIRDAAPKLHDASGHDWMGKLDSVAADLRLEKNEGEHFLSVLALGYVLAAYKVYGRTEAQFADVGYEPLDEMSAI